MYFQVSGLSKPDPCHMADIMVSQSSGGDGSLSTRLRPRKVGGMVAVLTPIVRKKPSPKKYVQPCRPTSKPLLTCAGPGPSVTPVNDTEEEIMSIVAQAFSVIERQSAPSPPPMDRTLYLLSSGEEEDITSVVPRYHDYVTCRCDGCKDRRAKNEKEGGQ